MPLNQQNNTIACNFHRASSKHFYFTYVPKIYSFQNLFSKTYSKMACLGSCPWTEKGEKVTCAREKCTCPGQVDGVFLSPDTDAF